MKTPAASAHKGSAAAAGAGERGVGVAPPSYGIPFLDHAMGAAPGVVQLRRLNLGVHGFADIPDAVTLTPDVPTYGAAQALFGHNVASSMDVLLTPNHPQGQAPNALGDLFDRLPTKGKYTIPANAGRERSAPRLYIKGHLLNDNLGGPGSMQNLYPITHQANIDHDRLVEEPIKDRVNREGEVLRYQVRVTTGTRADSDMQDESGRALKAVDAQFDCTITEYPSTNIAHAVSCDVAIRSVWNGNAGNNAAVAMSQHFAHCDNLQGGQVKIMPRAKIKAEWDVTLLQIAVHLARASGMAVGKWMTSLKIGIGPKGAELVASGVGYETLTKTDKRTLTNARNVLEKFIDEQYSVYRRVEAGYDDTVDAPLDRPGPDVADQLDQEVRNTGDSIEQLDQLQDIYIELDARLRVKQTFFRSLLDLVYGDEPAKWQQALLDGIGLMHDVARSFGGQAQIAWIFLKPIATELLHIMLRQWRDSLPARITSTVKFDIFRELAEALNDGYVLTYPLTYVTRDIRVWTDDVEQGYVVIPRYTIIQYDKEPLDRMSRTGRSFTSFYTAYLLEAPFAGIEGKVAKDAVANVLL
jgi:hypothetical protein